jgi:cytochrome c peroxidase
MTRKPIRVVAALAAIIVVGFGVAALSRDHRPQAAVVDMNHGDVKFAKGELPRILNAAAATTAETPEDQLAAEGRKVFRDPSLFENGESCQTCHAEGTASARLGTMVHDTQADKTKKPTPPTDFDGPRDPPSLIDIAKTPPYFWIGDVPTLDAALARPVKGHMKKFVTGSCSTPSEECDLEAGRLAAQLKAYVKTLTPPTTSFDQGTMSESALRGEKLFQGKGGCIECHGGPDFTDNLVHNTGVPQVTFTSPYGTGTRKSNDLGAPPPPTVPECVGTPTPVACDQPPPATSAFVNTPQMRDLKNTAPYMHNGAFATLTDVVNFYNRDSTLAPLNLTGPEIADLVEYLKSL